MKNTSVLLIKLPSLAESPSSNIAKVDPQRFASAFESLIWRKTRFVEIGSSVDVYSVGPLSSNLSPKYKNEQRAFFQSQRQLFNRFLTLQRRLIDIKKQQFWAFQTKLIYCWPWTSLGLCLKAQALKICARIKKGLNLGKARWILLKKGRRGSTAWFLYAVRLDPKFKALKALKNFFFHCQELWHSGRAQA